MARDANLVSQKASKPEMRLFSLSFVCIILSQAKSHRKRKIEFESYSVQFDRKRPSKQRAASHR